MFNLTYHNQFYHVGRTVCEVIVLRNQHLKPEKEITPEFMVFIAERADNPGKSVTNNIEEIAGAVWKMFMAGLGIDPKMVCWVEVYPALEPITVETVYFESTYKGLSKDELIFASPHWEAVQLDWAAIKNNFDKKEEGK